MKRELLVSVGVAAISVVGLAGCSSGDQKSEPSSASQTSSASTTSQTSQTSPTSQSSKSASASAAAGAQTTLTIDGVEQPLDGAPSCRTLGDTVNIVIGQAGTGVAAILGSGDNPSVTSVALGKVKGVALAVGPGVGEATAKKDGNAYSIKGNATGADMTDLASGIITKPFELVVVCPQS